MNHDDHGTKKLAKLLNVDEVSLMHGSRGMALYVRIEKSTQGTTIDNEELIGAGADRLLVIAEKLSGLSDGLRKSLGHGDLKKATAYQAPRELSWEDVGGFVPYEVDRYAQRQVQRSYQAPPRQAEVPSAPVAPVVSEPMGSRFHAIVEELKRL